MTDEEKTEETPVLPCEFCGHDGSERAIHEIMPYRPKGWSPTIPYRTRICDKCLAEQKGNVTLAGDAPPPPTEEEVEEELAESPNPMKGATMQERVETVIGTKSGEHDEE